MQTLKEFRLQQHYGHVSPHKCNEQAIEQSIAFTIDYCMNIRSLYEGLCAVAKIIASPSRSVVIRKRITGHTYLVLKQAHRLWDKEEKIKDFNDYIRMDYERGIPEVIKFIIENPDRFGVMI